MEKRGIIILVSLTILLIVGIVSVYATTRITDNQITAQNFNMSGGRFNQGANILLQAGIIKDDSNGGNASYLEGPRAVFVLGRYAYVASETEDSFCIFDIYNPANITEISCIRDNSSGGKAHYLDGAISVVVSGKYAYVTARNEDTLTILDISNPSNITEVGYIQDDSQGGKAHGLNGPGLIDGFFISGKYAYVLSSQVDYALSVFDISDPTNITEVGYVKSDTQGGTIPYLGRPRELFIQGKYAYIVSMMKNGVGNNSLIILDISNPKNITEVGHILDDSNNGTATVMDGSRGVYVSGRYAYIVSNLEHSITIIDISNKSNPIQVNYIQDDSLGGTASYLDGANLITGAGDYLYVTSNGNVETYDDSLCVFDVSNPYDIKEVQCVLDTIDGGTFSGVHNPKAIFLKGKYLYLTAATDNSLSIIEISGIESPSVKTGTIETSLINILGNAHILRDLYIGNGLNVAGSGLFSSGLGVFGTLELIGNLTINGNQGITGNYTNGNCWTAYSGGIIYETNCTSS